MFSAPSNLPVSLVTPLTYADRLRIRHPGDAKFALGPHMDGGSVERWEDENYRKVYKEILTGNWEDFDAWNMGRFAIRWAARRADGELMARTPSFREPKHVRRSRIRESRVDCCCAVAH